MVKKRKKDNINIYDITDKGLMERMRDGDSSGIKEIINRHQNSLLNFFSRMGAYNDAEDLVQETFIKLYKYRMKYEPKAKFTTFLYTLARRSLLDWHRKINRRREVFLFEGLHFEAKRGNIKYTEIQMDIQNALDSLSAKVRIILVMKIYQGLKYAEIAEILGIPLGTVKSRINYGIGQLKERLSVKDGK